MDLSDRNIRQRDIISQDKLDELAVIVAGVGAIGRQVALQLAAIGVKQLVLIDPDVVGVENLASQGFLETDVGSNKVDAVADLCGKINSGISIKTHKDKFKTKHIARNRKQLVIFSCVDDMDARRFIKSIAETFGALFIDSRMSAEVFRVLTVNDSASSKHYDTTLFSNAEAFQGSCTSKTTIYCASIAAGMMIAQFTRWLRNIPMDANFQFNVLTTELSIEQEQHIE